jgi:hypothetical protein
MRGPWRRLFDFTATPDLETPAYTVLRRFASYEVREYQPFLVAETRSGVDGFNPAGRATHGVTFSAQFEPFVPPWKQVMFIVPGTLRKQSASQLITLQVLRATCRPDTEVR